MRKRAPTSREDAIQLSLGCLSSVLAQELKPSELEVGIVSTDVGEVALTAKQTPSERAAPVARWRLLTEQELDVQLTRLAEKD